MISSPLDLYIGQKGYNTDFRELVVPLCKTLSIKRTLHFHFGLYLKISQFAFPPLYYTQNLEKARERSEIHFVIKNSSSSWHKRIPVTPVLTRMQLIQPYQVKVTANGQYSQLPVLGLGWGPSEHTMEGRSALQSSHRDLQMKRREWCSWKNRIFYCFVALLALLLQTFAFAHSSTQTFRKLDEQIRW